MSTMGIATISMILLLLIAWPLWIELEIEDPRATRQGILLSILTIALFLRVVLGDAIG